MNVNSVTTRTIRCERVRVDSFGINKAPDLYYLFLRESRRVLKRDRSWLANPRYAVYFVSMYITCHDGYAQMTKGHRRASM